MKRRNPDYTSRAVLHAPNPPEHILEAALWNIAHNVQPFDPHVLWAYEIHAEVAEREVLQAFLITRASDVEINAVLRVPVLVLQAYRHLFFNLDAFRDELHILSWIRAYEEGRRGTEHGAQLLRHARMMGFKGLQWIYNHTEVVVEPGDVQRQVMTDAFFRGQSHRMYAINSDEAKAALALSKTALTVANTLSKKPDTQGVNALAIKLRHREMTTPVEEVRPDDVPLH